MITVEQLLLISKAVRQYQLRPLLSGVILESDNQRLIASDGHIIISIFDSDLDIEKPSSVIPLEAIKEASKAVKKSDRKVATVAFDEKSLTVFLDDEEDGPFSHLVKYKGIDTGGHWLNFDNVLNQAKMHHWDSKKGVIGWYQPKYIALLNEFIEAYKGKAIPQFIFPPDLLSPMTVRLVTEESRQVVTIVIMPTSIDHTNLEG